MDDTPRYFLWALILGGISAVSLPLGSWVGLNVRFSPRTIAVFAAFGAGALIAALSVELVAPTAFALTEPNHEAGDGHAFADFAALLLGSVAGGMLFVALDTVVNQKGGYLRKTSTTLEHFAKRHRKSVRQLVEAVLTVRPFNTLSSDLVPRIGQMLRPKEFKEGQRILGPGLESAAYIFLQGEVDVEIAGKSEGSLGPGTMLGALMILVPGTGSLATIRAKTDVKCLSLRPEDIDELRALCPEFDEAWRPSAWINSNNCSPQNSRLQSIGPARRRRL